MSKLEPQALTPAPATVVGAGAAKPRKRRRYSLLNRRDKILLTLMVGIPLAIFLVLIWGMTLVSVGLAFTNWDGVQPIKFVGLDNFTQLFTTYPFFWPALSHNLLWLLVFVFFATPMGILLAVCLDRPMRGTSIYQTIFFTPVVLSLALVGFIWELQYSPLAGNGFIDSALVSLGIVSPANAPDWLGDSSINIWAVLIAASWRHIGYIMVLYLAGLKSVDPSLREAAAIDGANERQTFFHVVFPVMAPINVVIVVVTAIESLRAFDIAYIVNHGKNGLELLSTLITNNSISEASLLGFGSAIAVVLLTISLVPIAVYLTRVMRSEES
ncbi:MAG: sugar ABC transporter permease [Candidatus Limnocylindrales bacterium]|jgi:ABC-type sugar transport system permease subunit